MTSAAFITRPRPLPSDLQQTADFIRTCQTAEGAIPWFKGGKLDPWDHIEAAMALSVAGYADEAVAAYTWLARQQRADGSWYGQYFVAEDGPELNETHFVAYIATGVWHHYLSSNNPVFLRQFFPCVDRAIEFVLRFQSPFGDIAWAVNANGRAENDALLTACCSILRSLDCAVRIAAHLGEVRPAWATAAQALKHTIAEQPERFDRTWESKARYSMDWYYPILAGALDYETSQQRLAQRWSQFIQPQLGCRCVSDEPWVTMAETSELVMALVACDKIQQANELYNTLAQWRDSDGGYWTGYVFRDQTIWPEEKTTWTAGAVILAADALFHYSAASALFNEPLLALQQ